MQGLAEGAGFSFGNSLIDGSGASPVAAGLKAVATLVTGLSAGSFLPPISSKEASASDFAAGMSFLRSGVTPVGAVVGSVGRASLDQKEAAELGAWAANMALALSESTVSAAGASAAAGSFLRMLSSREASAPDFAETSFTRAFLAPHAYGPGTIRRRWNGKIALIG